MRRLETSLFSNLIVKYVFFGFPQMQSLLIPFRIDIPHCFVNIPHSFDHVIVQIRNIFRGMLESVPNQTIGRWGFFPKREKTIFVFLETNKVELAHQYRN